MTETALILHTAIEH